MSIARNGLDVERCGHDALEEELRKARIELEKSQAVVNALTSVLARMNESRRDEKPQATLPPKLPMPKPSEPPRSPRPPEQKPSYSFYESDEDVSFLDCLIEFKDIWVGVIKFFIGPRKRTHPNPKTPGDDLAASWPCR